jgi:hypothetical protein
MGKARCQVRETKEHCSLWAYVVLGNYASKGFKRGPLHAYLNQYKEQLTQSIAGVARPMM